MAPLFFGTTFLLYFITVIKSLFAFIWDKTKFYNFFERLSACFGFPPAKALPRCRKSHYIESISPMKTPQTFSAIAAFFFRFLHFASSHHLRLHHQGLWFLD